MMKLHPNLHPLSMATLEDQFHISCTAYEGGFVFIGSPSDLVSCGLFLERWLPGWQANAKTHTVIAADLMGNWKALNKNQRRPANNYGMVDFTIVKGGNGFIKADYQLGRNKPYAAQPAVQSIPTNQPTAKVIPLLRRSA